MEEYETVLLVKPEVFMFRIPPRPSNRGYRAADWKLDSPDWTGRMRVVSKGKKCFIKLEDKNTGELFAVSPVEKYPGVAVEAVMDSSRYFVLRIEDDNGRAAFIGIGFADRGDSFDLNVSLQEHFKWLQKSEEIEKEQDAPESKSNLDLSFKEGQTIKINMNIAKKSGNSKPRPKTGGFSGTPGLLPPPPGGFKFPPPSKSSQQTVSQAPATSTNAPTSPSTNDLLLDFASQPSDSSASQTNSGASQVPPQDSEFWGDFTSASGETPAAPSKGSSSESWISF